MMTDIKENLIEELIEKSIKNFLDKDAFNYQLTNTTIEAIAHHTVDFIDDSKIKDIIERKVYLIMSDSNFIDTVASRIRVQLENEYNMDSQIKYSVEEAIKRVTSESNLMSNLSRLVLNEMGNAIKMYDDETQ